ncbi:MAG: hypothetical protein IPP47_04600 [Bryobacterales bacterium]|nr:hypothetical protein [Bryobacterales bacterium]
MKQVFPIVPAGAGSPWTTAAIALLLVGLLFLFGYIFYSSRYSTFEVSAEGLRIRGDLYGRLVPRGALRLEQARVLNLNTEREYALSWRTNGIGMPGYSSGWFRLKNGGKALAFLTTRDSVLYLPTSEGYAVLLSTPEPQALLAALQAGR